MAGMTERQKRFGDEYIIDMNATQAAIRAGYAEKYAHTNAHKLLQITAIKEYIAARMSEKNKDLIASQDEILEYYTSVMRGKSTSHVLARQCDGSETVIEKPPDEKERLTAAKELAKRYGLQLDEATRTAYLDKLKAETARIKGESPEDDPADDGFIDALQSEGAKVWQDQ